MYPVICQALLLSFIWAASSKKNAFEHVQSYIGVCLFVCVEVLRPSQPNGVMSSAVSLPSHTFTGQA